MKPYTLITGASQGFGKAMALEFAARKMNMVLIALPNSGLDQLSKFIENNFRVDVHSMERDLSITNSCYDIAEYIAAQKIDIKYLVNNAGVLSRGLFENLNDDYILKQIEVNITAPTLLIRLLLDNLKKNAPSAILNISSMAGFFALPKKQVYGGTKAYLLSFSKSLRKELKPYDISVSIVCPGGMNTTTGLCLQNRKMNWISRSSILDPEYVAQQTIVQFEKNKEVIIPGRVNKAFMFLNSILPETIKSKLTSNAI